MLVLHNSAMKSGSVRVLSHVQLFASPWTVGSMGFFREGYCSGLLIPSSGDLRDLGIEPGSPAGQADSLP